MKKETLTKILAVAGTVIAWFPILAPISLTLILLIGEGIFRFDFLMPAELFLAALVGGGLLFWAALRARSHNRVIGWSLVIAAIMLFGGQELAVVTGLASGAHEPAGWRLIIVLATLIIYILALIAIGVGGLLLLRKLFGRKQMPAESH